ncbi:hypothetical protein JTE90_000304 [Oedothorax gibbosus]|uniref:Uncharacterized protein n=1 Tax=Oedothorax gibbosus TaxID=931172 RepID=A0AAV6VVD9_9ARAC|nr:hypothetical protein JTE90_000304 [Oedothorax gibbosus]
MGKNERSVGKRNGLVGAPTQALSIQFFQHYLWGLVLFWLPRATGCSSEDAEEHSILFPPSAREANCQKQPLLMDFTLEEKTPGPQSQWTNRMVLEDPMSFYFETLGRYLCRDC